MSEKVEIKIGGGSFTTVRNAVASIDPEVCINCGKCRRACPTEAIAEYQRPICRLCPDCAESPEMFPSEIKAYAAMHSCSIGCPLGTVPEAYISLIRAGRYKDAYDLISELNPLPSICAHVCHHPCESECKRGLLLDLNKPLAIRGLKRFVTETVPAYRAPFTRRLNQKIAIIGAGPAGITAAFDLVKKGYGVKIFEAAPKPGGMVRKCIPSFRLDKQVMLDEYAALEKAGIEIVYNAKIGRNPSVAQLKAEYDAVLIAVGAAKGVLLPLPGMESNPYRVYDAVTLLDRVNRGAPYWVNAEKPERKDVDINIGKHAVVIGGGSVAMDTARTLVRMGVEKVTCACLESEAEMPAPKSEVADARAEGIEIICGVSPQKLNCDSDWMAVEGIDFAKVERIEKDEKGRIKPILVENSTYTFACDSVVFAVGQKADVAQLASFSGIEMDGSKIKYDENMQTNIPGVFVAGDVVEARGSIINAMASGRKAALAIDNLLQDRELGSRIEHELHTGPQSQWIYRVMLEDAKPQKMPKLRYHDTFEVSELGFDEKTAVEESKRCMKCGYEKVDTDKCIGCGVCANNCPVQAITMKKA